MGSQKEMEDKVEEIYQKWYTGIDKNNKREGWGAICGGITIIAVPKISSGAVAQHLVGAKLALRFPHLRITNDVTAASDASTNRPGDFKIGTTAFHITLSP